MGTGSILNGDAIVAIVGKVDSGFNPWLGSSIL